MTATIKSITNKGIVKIRFSKAMFTLFNYTTELNNSLSFKLVSADDVVIYKSIKYKVTGYDSKTLSVSLSFDDYTAVSQNQEQDILYVQFIDYLYFID